MSEHPAGSVVAPPPPRVIVVPPFPERKPRPPAAPTPKQRAMISVLRAIDRQRGALFIGKRRLGLSSPDIGVYQSAGLLEGDIAAQLKSKGTDAVRESKFRVESNANPLIAGHAAPFPIIKVDTKVGWVDVDWSADEPAPVDDGEPQATGWWSDVDVWRGKLTGVVENDPQKPRTDNSTIGEWSNAEFSLLRRDDEPDAWTGTVKASFETNTIYRSPDGEWRYQGKSSVQADLTMRIRGGLMWWYGMETPVLVATAITGPDKTKGSASAEGPFGPFWALTGWDDTFVRLDEGDIGGARSLDSVFAGDATGTLTVSLVPQFGGGGGFFRRRLPPWGDPVKGPYFPKRDPKNPIFMLTNEGRQRTDDERVPWLRYAKLWIVARQEAKEKAALSETQKIVVSDVALKEEYATLLDDFGKAILTSWDIIK